MVTTTVRRQSRSVSQNMGGSVCVRWSPLLTAVVYIVPLKDIRPTLEFQKAEVASILELFRTLNLSVS